MSSLFNECMVSLYLYLLLGLANSCSIPDKLGYGLLGVVAASILSNVASFLAGVVQSIRAAMIKPKATVPIKPDTTTTEVSQQVETINGMDLLQNSRLSQL